MNRNSIVAPRKKQNFRLFLLQILLLALSLCAVIPLCALFLATLNKNVYAALLAPDNPIWIAYRNSLLLCCASLAGQLIISILGGWGLAAYRFPGRSLLLFSCIVFMLLPVQAVLLPQYLLLRSCGLLDSLWALILPSIFSPLGTVLLWHGFSAIPHEIIAAAQAEGAGFFVIMRRIVLPECRRELSALMLISLAETWNLLEQPMAYLKSPARYPLSVYLSTAAIPSPAQRAAACIVTLAPVLVLFFILIRWILPRRPKKGTESA